MLAFLQANWMTGAVLLVLLLCVFFAIRKIVKDKKTGKGTCGQNCADCPYHSHCATDKTQND